MSAFYRKSQVSCRHLDAITMYHYERGFKFNVQHKSPNSFAKNVKGRFTDIIHIHIEIIIEIFKINFGPVLSCLPALRLTLILFLADYYGSLLLLRIVISLEAREGRGNYFN